MARSNINEDELVNLVMNTVFGGVNSQTSQISDDRIYATTSYLRYPYGDERAGRSQIVSGKLYEIINTMMPDLMRCFFSSDEIFSAFSPDADNVELDEAITDYLNYVFMSRNNGFIIAQNAIQDALLYKNGITKVAFEEKERIEFRQSLNIGDIEYQALLEREKRKEIRITNVEEVQVTIGEIDVSAYSVGYEEYFIDECIKIYPVPPEEIFINWDAPSDIQDAQFFAHCASRTRAELIAMGYKPSIVNDLPYSKVDSLWNSQEKLVRFQTMGLGNNVGLVQDNVLCIEAYLYYDLYNNKCPVLTRVFVAGDRLMDIGRVYEIPIASGCASILPHRFWGVAIADQVTDLQRIETAMMRTMNDNVFYQNNPQWIIKGKMIAPQVIDSIRQGNFNAIIYTPDTDAVIERAVPPQIAAGTLPVLDFYSGIAESRTGATRLNQGLDGNTLTKTASGQMQLQSKANGRIEYIARQFSETYFPQIARLIYNSARRNITQPVSFKWRGIMRTVNPAEWPDYMTFKVSVGLGITDKQNEVAKYAELFNKLVETVQLQGGMTGQIVSIQSFYETLAAMANAAGIKNVSRFITNPETSVVKALYEQIMQLQQALQAQNPPTDPLSEAQKIKSATDLQIARGRQELDAERIRLDAERIRIDAAGKQIEAYKAAEEAQNNRGKMLASIAKDISDLAKDSE